MEPNLIELSKAYRRALAGNQIIQALQMHAAEALVNIKFVNLNDPEPIIITKVFEAAYGQGKLAQLIGVIQKDGFDVSYTDLSEKTFNSPINYENEVKRFDLKEYLQWIKSETEYVDIRGIGETKASQAVVFPILKLYTELYVQTGLRNVDLERGRMRGSMRIPLTKMVSTNRCLVVMGDPGSGKTTFLKFIARKIIEDRFENSETALPFYLRLAEAYEFAIENKAEFAPQIFIDYFVALGKKEGFELSGELIQQYIDLGDCIWLLDSLDELPSVEAREIMVSVVERAARRWGKCKFVLTSRPLPVTAKAIPVDFEKVGIDSWTQKEIKSFVKVWTSLLYPNVSKDIYQKHWTNLLSAIMERPDLRSLSRNAVMVTAMAVVHYNEKRLPEGRADLLEALIYWLIRARTRYLGSKEMSPKFIELRFRELALAMMEAEGGRKRRVGRLWAAQQIVSNFDNSIDLALEFIGMAETETGVLVRRGEGDIEFWHLSFQEYLAALAIAGLTDSEEHGWWSKICNQLDSLEWREVLVFVPACLNRLGGARVDLFFDRLGKSCEESSLDVKVKKSHLEVVSCRHCRLPNSMA